MSNRENLIDAGNRISDALDFLYAAGEDDSSVALGLEAALNDIDMLIGRGLVEED